MGDTENVTLETRMNAFLKDKMSGDVLKQSYEQVSELLALLTDAIAVAIQCHHKASHTSCIAMKMESHKDYGSVCS